MYHKMNLRNNPFYLIKDGKKDIELRLNDEKRQKIKKGDIIEFTNISNGEKVSVVVLNKYLFNTFTELYSQFDKVRMGYNEEDKADPKDMEDYYSLDEINKYGVVGIEILLLEKVGNAILTDNGICPTCFNREHDECLYGSNADKMLYEDDIIECFLVGNPRAKGHVAISSKKHYKDMMEIPDELCEYVFVFAKKAMNLIKKVYDSESVYLCTMCDGPMNHFHVQLIPRYDFEKRGSNNFVKTRMEYEEDIEKIIELRKSMDKFK